MGREKTTSGRQQSIFKTDEGRQEILRYYHKLLVQNDFPYQEKYVDTSYGKTYLLEAGDPMSPALVLLHGSTSNSAAWFSDIRELWPAYRVISIELLGDAGHSEPIRHEMTSPAYAEWLREVFDKAGISKASVMGNSLGGWMALRFASRYPERVEKLVLLAASGLAPIQFTFVLRLIAFGMSGRGAEKIAAMIYGNDTMPPEVLEFMRVISQNYNPYTGAMPVFAERELRRLAMPILYVAGAEDKLTNAKGSAKRLSRILPHAEVTLIENRGHVIFGVLPRVRRFLDNPTNGDAPRI